MKMKTIGLALIAILLAGCGPQNAGQPSGAQDVLDTMSQKNNIEAGKRTAAKVREIGAQQQQNRREAGAE
jgi:hypothetical protein